MEIGQKVYHFNGWIGINPIVTEYEILAIEEAEDGSAFAGMVCPLFTAGKTPPQRPTLRIPKNVLENITSPKIVVQYEIDQLKAEKARLSKLIYEIDQRIGEATRFIDYAGVCTA